MTIELIRDFITNEEAHQRDPHHTSLWPMQRHLIIKALPERKNLRDDERRDLYYHLLRRAGLVDALKAVQAKDGALFAAACDRHVDEVKRPYDSSTVPIALLYVVGRHRMGSLSSTETETLKDAKVWAKLISQANRRTHIPGILSGLSALQDLGVEHGRRALATLQLVDFTHYRNEHNAPIFDGHRRSYNYTNLLFWTMVGTALMQAETRNDTVEGMMKAAFPLRSLHLQIFDRFLAVLPPVDAASSNAAVVVETARRDIAAWLAQHPPQD